MDETETRLMLSFGRAYRMLEAWAEAGLLEATRRTMAVSFGNTPEFRLLEVLAGAQEALQLTDIWARAGVSRRDVLKEGRVRSALARLEKSGAVINVGTLPRPRYQLNLLSAEAKLLISLFRRDDAQAPRIGRT